MSLSVLSAALDRPLEHLRERLLIGRPAECVEKLALLRDAGLRQMFLWPIEEEPTQLQRFHEEIRPQLPPEPD